MTTPMVTRMVVIKLPISVTPVLLLAPDVTVDKSDRNVMNTSLQSTDKSHSFITNLA